MGLETELKLSRIPACNIQHEGDLLNSWQAAHHRPGFGMVANRRGSRKRQRPGAIIAIFDKLEGVKAVTAKTVNGKVDLTLPANADADVSVSPSTD